MGCPRCGGTGKTELLWPHGGESEVPCEDCEGTGDVARTRPIPMPAVLEREVSWLPTSEEDVFEAVVDGQSWRLEIRGDALPICLVHVEGREVAAFELGAWPASWKRELTSRSPAPT